MELKLELTDNEWPFEYTDHDRNIARAVCFDSDGYFYFVRVERDDDFGRATLIETSGGGVENGEDLETAIKRELHEELGADTEVICRIGTVSDHYNLIHRHNINNYFLCKVISFGDKNMTQQEIDDFHLSTLKMTYEQAVSEYENMVVIFQDFACLDLDPQNPTHIFAGGRTGLYEYNNGRMVKYHNVDNSLLEYSTADCIKNYILTLGVKFDKQGNLWCLNSLAESASILKLSTDGKWESYHKKILVDDNNRSLANLRGLTMDSRGYLWFVNNHWALPSFYCFDPSSDAINYFSNFVNEDGTTITTTGVRCIEEDKEGNMWIGTNVGPLMLLAKDISESNAVLQQVKVPRNDGTNFADYLLSGVDITCIAIDGGGRKWFGTNGNGVYLISEDNMEQVQHFTNSNSALLSNNIEAITINDKTGEVFFGTDNGLCSYMSDASATNENMTSDNVYAYPNPVEPDYTGLITIVGLSYNADVKIVTANGALVASGTSNGGSFTWDGCDLNGKRVASGVYMVETATSEGKKGTVCKIAIVR